MATLGPVARAEQVKPGDPAAVVGVGVGLLLDGEPAGAEPLGPEPEPLVQMQAAADLADSGLDELERLGTVPLPQARRQQGAQAGISGERAAEPGEVLSGEALEERPGEGRLWPY